MTQYDYVVQEARLSMGRSVGAFEPTPAARHLSSAQFGSSYENRWVEMAYAFCAIVVMALAAVLGTRFINHQKR